MNGRVRDVVLESVTRGGSVTVIVGWGIGSVAMIVSKGKTLPSYLDMFRYDRPVEIGGFGDDPVDKIGYGAGEIAARMKAMWSGSWTLTYGPRARTHSSVDHEAPKQVALRSSHLDMQ